MEAVGPDGKNSPVPWNAGDTSSDAVSGTAASSDASPRNAVEPSNFATPPSEASPIRNPDQTASTGNGSDFKLPPNIEAPKPAASPPELDFTRLALADGAEAPAIVDYLLEIDKSIKQLLLAAQARRVTRDEAIRQSGILSNLKYAAAEKLGRIAESPLHKELSVLAKIEALSHSAGMGEEKAANELRQLAGNPANFTSRAAAHQAAIAMLGLTLSDLAGGLADAGEVLNQLDIVLAEPAELKRPDFFAVAQVVRILDQHNVVDVSKSAKNKIVTAFATNPDPQIGSMLWQLQVGDSPEFNAFNEGLAKPDLSPAEFDQTIQELLKLAPNQWSLAYLTQQLNQVEFSGQVEKAGLMASKIEQNLSWISLTDLNKDIQRTLDGFRKRVSLVGTTISFDNWAIEHEGRPFDPKSLQGKVVLIDFWASWCQPCRAEFPNLREQYEKYRQKGFEIVGVNLDKDIEAMQSVIQSDALSWLHSRTNDPDRIEFSTPQAVEFGVEAIPFMVLIGPDGKVVAIHARGRILNQKLSELLP